jgi:hypothetical protein
MLPLSCFPCMHSTIASTWSPLNKFRRQNYAFPFSGRGRKRAKAAWCTRFSIRKLEQPQIYAAKSDPVGQRQFIHTIFGVAA